MTTKLLKLIGLSILLGIIGWVIFSMVNPKMNQGVPHEEEHSIPVPHQQ